jgi:hypothetical protein
MRERSPGRGANDTGMVEDSLKFGRRFLGATCRKVRVAPLESNRPSKEMRLNFLIFASSVWKARITESDPVGNSSRSERTRVIEAPCACLLFSHTADEDDGTGATTRRYVL